MIFAYFEELERMHFKKNGQVSRIVVDGVALCIAP